MFTSKYESNDVPLKTVVRYTMPTVRKVLAKISDDLLSRCPWHIYTAVHGIVHYLPPCGHGSSSACILTEGLAGTYVPNAFGWSKTDILPGLDWSCCLKVLHCLTHTITLTMFFWCCFISRDCGGSGKRKSGKDVFCRIFIVLLFTF